MLPSLTEPKFVILLVKGSIAYVPYLAKGKLMKSRAFECPGESAGVWGIPRKALLHPFLITERHRIFPFEDREQEPQRRQEQGHTDSRTDKQGQEREGRAGSIGHLQIRWDQVGKLRYAPSAEKERCFDNDQDTRQAITAQK